MSLQERMTTRLLLDGPLTIDLFCGISLSERKGLP